MPPAKGNKAVSEPRNGTARKRRGGRESKERRAVFLDRDGVLNDLQYNPEEGSIGSPLSAKELKVFPYSGGAVRAIQRLGFKVILVSNQPGVAKRQLTQAEFSRMVRRVRSELAKQGCRLDGEYYCLHHPDALLARYRQDCDCRKPKPGLVLRAARENDIDLEGSYFVGDALADVKAGTAAGCKTILLGHVTSFLARLIEEEGVRPDYVAPSLRDVPALLRKVAPSAQ